MELRIDHVAIWTADLERLKSFYVTHFGAVAGARYENPARGFRSYFLSFAGGARLELMSIEGLHAIDHVEPRAGYAHLAVSVGSQHAVDALTERLVRILHEI